MKKKKKKPKPAGALAGFAWGLEEGGRVGWDGMGWMDGWMETRRPDVVQEGPV